MANLMPVIAPMQQLVRSPTGSWLLSATATSAVTSPSLGTTPKTNGTRVTSPVPDGRPARQDKKRMSLSFFGIGNSASEEDATQTEKESKQEKSIVDDSVDVASTSASSRSRSKDRSKHRISQALVSPASPVPEALPHFPSQSASSQNSLAKIQSHASSRQHSVDGRPPTSKSERSVGQSKSSSVKKRLSNFYLGKKSSKASVRGRVDDTLEEE